MRKIRITITSFLVLFALFINIGSALAVPPLPSSFYGKVSLNGSNLLEGTVVEAIIDEKVISESQTMIYLGESVYSIDINGDDPGTSVIEGGRENDVVSFRIGGLMAKETGIWHSGTNEELNLTITSVETPQPPEPTKTPVPTQTDIVQPTQIPTTKPTQTSKPNPTIAATTQMIQNTSPQSTSVVAEVPAAELTQLPTNQELNQTEIVSEAGNQPIATSQVQQESSQAAYSLNKGDSSNEIGNQSQPLNQKTLIFLALCLFIVIAGVFLARYLLNKKSIKKDLKP